MAHLSREEKMQEALIGWLVAGGSLEGLFIEVEMFVESLGGIEWFKQDGFRAVALQRLHESLDRVQWLAGKVDRAGLPKIPPQMLPSACPDGEACPDKAFHAPAAPAPAGPDPTPIDEPATVSLSSLEAFRSGLLDRSRNGRVTVLAACEEFEKVAAAPAPAPAPEPQPAFVLIEAFGGVVSSVRASVPVQVSIWNRDEVREGLVPTVLRELPLQPIRTLREEDELQQFPETKVVNGQTLHLLRVDGQVRFDRQGRPIYCSVPGKEA